MTLSPGFILEVARAGGRDLTRKGAPRGEYLTRCPWQERHRNGDEHPSCRLNPEKNSFFCDPCGKGGGAKDLAHALGVDFKRLVQRHRTSPSRSSSRLSTRGPSLLFESAGELGSVTRERLSKNFGKTYSSETWAAFGVLEGKVWPEGKPDRAEPCIAFPQPGGGHHLFRYTRADRDERWRFSKGGMPELIAVGLERPEPIILCEGEWDAMTAYEAGFAVATGTGGCGTWRESWSQRFKDRAVVASYDVDDPGRRGALKPANSLPSVARGVWNLLLPLSGDPEKDGKDLTDYVSVEGAEAFRSLVSTILATPRLASTKATPAVEREEHPSSPLSLIEDVLSGLPSCTDSTTAIDLLRRLMPILKSLSPAERELVFPQLKRKLGIGIGAIREEIQLAILRPTSDSDTAELIHEPTEQELGVLSDPALLERFIDDTTRLGIVGEEDNRKVVLLVAVSSQQEEPLNLVTKGESSVGKNYLVNSVRKILPTEWIVDVSGLSPQALAYWQGDLHHKILIITEAAGAERADYNLRVLQSEGQITVCYVTKVEGQLQTVEKKVEGPAATITTTTRTSLHPENETRLLEIAPDESAEQTARINQCQAFRRAHPPDPTEQQKIIDLWTGVLKSLKTMPVITPFAPFIKFPTNRVRARRDFPKLLALAEASAFLHQHQRGRVQSHGVEAIVASLCDYAVAYELVATFFSDLQTGLSPTKRRVLGLLRGDPAQRFTSRQVAEKMGWSPESGLKKATRTLNGLVTQGLVDATPNQKGIATIYWTLPETEKATAGVSTPDEVSAAWQAEGGHLDIAWSRWMSRLNSLEGKE